MQSVRNLDIMEWKKPNCHYDPLSTFSRNSFSTGNISLDVKYFACMLGGVAGSREV